MRKNKLMVYAFSAMFLGCMAACSDDEETNIEQNQTPGYIMGTDTDGKVTCDHLLFNENGEADVLLVHSPAAEEEFVKNGAKNSVILRAPRGAPDVPPPQEPRSAQALTPPGFRAPAPPRFPACASPFPETFPCSR